MVFPSNNKCKKNLFFQNATPKPYNDLKWNTKKLLIYFILHFFALKYLVIYGKLISLCEVMQGSNVLESEL